jgi:CRISPR/Cas system-associated exonuclease Cas4 (RecB family)
MAFRRVDDSLFEVEEGRMLASELYKQFNEFHSMNVEVIKEIELEFLRQKIKGLQRDFYQDIEKGLIIFRPSGASKCPRELYYQFIREQKDKVITYPFQKRWLRNSTAIHEAVQKDFLYMEKVMENPKFVIAKTWEGLPAWEENIKTIKVFDYKGKKFAISGMMDGILHYYPEDKKVGFEFKTKTNSIGQVGTYKLKEASDNHKNQCTAYSLMFDLDEFIIMYEAVVKDYWSAGDNAKIDFRTFYYAPTEKDKEELLNKFATVVEAVEKRKPPEKDTSKCLFCEYKDICEVEL